MSASVDLACRYKNKEVIAFSSFPPHQTCSVSPIFTRYIQQNKTKESPTSWPQTYCYLSMATSLSSQYPTVVIEFCPQTLKRTSEREKINPWLLNHSSWPRSWTILYFFCPGTKCAKDIIWIYHKINCFFLKTEVSLKWLVGWIEFI